MSVACCFEFAIPQLDLYRKIHRDAFSGEVEESRRVMRVHSSVVI